MRLAAGVGLLGMCICLITVCPAAASVVLGPYTFDDNAFADDATVEHATVGVVGAASLHDALAGADLTSWATLDVNYEHERSLSNTFNTLTVTFRFTF